MSPAPCTTAGSAPSRCVASFGLAPGLAQVAFLHNVPYHGALVYRLPVVPRSLPPCTRLQRAGRYQWCGPEVVGLARDALAATDEVFPVSAEADLAARWLLWHRRAEFFLQQSVHAGHACVEVRPERPKGSFPRARCVAPGPAHREAEPLALRRLRRLHRAFAERVRYAVAASAPLAPADDRRWQQAAAAPLRLLRMGPPWNVWRAAVPSLTRSCNSSAPGHGALPLLLGRAMSGSLRSKSSGPALSLLPSLPRRWPAPGVPFGVPPRPLPPTRRGSTRGAFWLLALARRLSRARPLLCLPWTRSGLLSVPCPGLLVSSELKTLALHAPSLLEELHALWCHTTLAAPAGLPEDLVDWLWAWKAVGVSKKTPYDSRPIFVASVLVRSWHKALLSCWPAPPAGQWCGRKGDARWR